VSPAEVRATESTRARRTHDYRVTIRWTGDLGHGTREYAGYSRDHTAEVEGRPTLRLTSGLSPRSDPSRLNPDDLLVAAIASCHMLWYLHLCSTSGVVVSGYVDHAEATLELDPDGGGRFTQATLRPEVTVREGSLETARRLHAAAHEKCFIASSLNFPIRCVPEIRSEEGSVPE